MASYIKTLKEDNGDITYPQTLGSAVFLTGGADLETELAGKASAASVAGKIDIGDVQSSDITASAVTTAKIADGAVTPGKLSFGKYSTTKQQIGTWTDNRPVYRIVLTGTTSSSASQTILLPSGVNIDIILSVSGGLTTTNGFVEPIQRVVTDAITSYGIGIGDFTATTFFFQHPQNVYWGRQYYIVLEYVEPAS